MIEHNRIIEIRRLFFAEHWPICTIAAELSVHHSVVKRAISAERFVRTSRLKAFASLEPYQSLIKKILDDHPKLRSTRLFAMLKSRGCPCSINTLRRYVKTIRKVSNNEAFFRLETLPAEQAQVDWAHFGQVQIGSTKRTLSCFVLVLSYSRYLCARFFLDQAMENFLRGHLMAFAAIGGVPRSILYDNLKSVVLERQGVHIHFHPRLLDLAGHYHFSAKPCAPYRGNEKGKVERSIHYLRYSFFEGRHFHSLEQINRELDEWLHTVANIRNLSAQRQSVTSLFATEKPCLLPLPEHPSSTDLLQPIRSGKTPYVRFDGNDYSIPHTHIKIPLTLVASEHVLRILDGQNKQIAIHVRSYDRGFTSEDPEHIKALEKQKHAASELRGRDRLRASCPSADAIFTAAVLREESLSRYSQALLRLFDDYGAIELEIAFLVALKKGAIGAASIAYLLEQRRQQQNKLPPLGPMCFDNPKASAVRVSSHSLKDYDQLSQHSGSLNQNNQNHDTDNNCQTNNETKKDTV